MPDLQNIYVSAIIRNPKTILKNAGFTLPEGDIAPLYLKSDLVFNSEYGLSALDMQEVAGKAWELMSVGIGKVKALDAVISPFLSRLTPDLNHLSLIKNYSDALRFFDPTLPSDRMLIAISDSKQSFTLFLEQPSDPAVCHGYMVAHNLDEQNVSKPGLYYAILDGGELNPYPLSESPYKNANRANMSPMNQYIEPPKQIEVEQSNQPDWSMNDVNIMFSRPEPVQVEEDVFDGIKF